MFHHDPLPIRNYPRVEVNGKRHYSCPETGAVYPSVTTFLSSFPKPHIDAWIARVGVEEADRVKMRAAARGTALHQCIEDHLANKPFRGDFEDKFRLAAIRKVIDKRISTVRMIEGPLISHSLKLAGTVDCVADFDGVPSIIDWKTSKKEISGDKLIDYGIQMTCYSLAIEEMYQLKCPQLVVVAAIDDEMGAQVIKAKRSDYFDLLFDKLKQFRQAHK